MKKLFVAALCAGMTYAAAGQVWEPDGAVIRFEVWNGVEWTPGPFAASPGERVEWRAVVEYVGTRTDLIGLGGALWQPVITSADNAGVVMDQLAPWRNEGVSASNIPGSILTEAEGDSGAPIDLGYGRVSFSQPPMLTTYSNTMTTFRHSGGSNGAPAGTWMRVAGSYVTQWPRDLSQSVPTSVDLLRVVRGVPSEQLPRDLRPEVHTEGVNDLVVFRQALILGDSPEPRSVQITTFRESIRRWGQIGAADDRRFFFWQSNYSDTGLDPSGHRTGVVIEPATIVVGGCDPIDFNHDENYPDIQDIEDFLSVFGGGLCPTQACGDIDFNNDGLTPDIVDIASFIRVFGGGPCE